MTEIVIVHGPMACGKTRNKQALMRALKCDHVIDGWDGRESLFNSWRRDENVPKTSRRCLVLTNHPDPKPPHKAEIITFGKAMRLAGLAN